MKKNNLLITHNTVLSNDEVNEIFIRDTENLEFLFKDGFSFLTKLNIYLFKKPTNEISKEDIYKWFYKKDIKSTFLEIKNDIEKLKQKFNNKFIVRYDLHYFLYNEIILECDENDLSLCFPVDVKTEDLNYVKEIIKESVIFKKINDKNKTSFNLITIERNSFDLLTQKIETPKINIDLNYTADLKEKISFLKKKLFEDKSGMILFHGLPGTGKTTFITWLLCQISKKKPVIYLPSHLTNILSDPSFITFMIENKNSILVIEEAENIFRSREDGNVSPSISNVLNMSDGILGNILNVIIIATFNTDKQNIDKALLRNGRLIAEHEFKELPLEQAKLVAKNIGISDDLIEKNINTDIPLCDIYAIKNNTLIKENKLILKPNKIGF
jgi:SpoVK/Ycf46/Vps4 family AAA+-type ATPase